MGWDMHDDVRNNDRALYLKTDRDIPTYISDDLSHGDRSYHACGIFLHFCQEVAADIRRRHNVLLPSDFIIGLNWLGGISEFDKYIWWLYPIGQILLLIGA